MDLDAWEERAAIMEYSGGMKRFEAETLAAQAQGRQRWEFKNEISKRNSEGPRHQCAHPKWDTKDDLPRMQRPQAKEERSMSECDV